MSCKWRVFIYEGHVHVTYVKESRVICVPWLIHFICDIWRSTCHIYEGVTRHQINESFTCHVNDASSYMKESRGTVYEDAHKSYMKMCFIYHMCVIYDAHKCLIYHDAHHDSHKCFIYASYIICASFIHMCFIYHMCVIYDAHKWRTYDIW